MEPLLCFSEGRTFRTAVRLSRTSPAREERMLGMVAHCPLCGDQQVQSLWKLRPWDPCLCDRSCLSISGPLWIGPMQHLPTLLAMDQQGAAAAWILSKPGKRLLDRLIADPGHPARCWPMGVIGRCLAQGTPSMQTLVEALAGEGFRAFPSGIMLSQIRSDAPWPRILATARRLAGAGDLDGDVAGAGAAR